MIIKRVEVGYLKENCYILVNNNECLIIDPGDEFKKIDKEIGNLKVLKILITHSHFDHVGAVEEIKNKYSVDVLKYDNLEEKEYTIGSFTFKVIYNPGHSSDSVSFLFDDKLFCGDFIFKDGIGRCDLPTGSIDEMKKSLDKIKQYKNLIIFPGHGESTTLEEELL